MAGLKIPEPKQAQILQPGDKENQLVQGYQKVTEDLQGKVAPIRQEMQQVGNEIAQIENPPTPQLQAIPQYAPRERESNEMVNFAGLAMGLAGLATKAVRGDITLALTAAGSAMKGFNEGRMQQADEDIRKFNTTMKSVIEANNARQTAYNNVLNDRKLTLAQKQQRLSILTHQYQDEVGMAALQKGDIKFLLDREDKIRNATNQLEMKRLGMEQSFELRRMSAEMALMRASNSGIGGANQGGLNQQAIDMLAREAIKDKGVLANLGRGIQGARDLRSITNRMAEILATEGGSGMAQRRQEYRADSNSLNKLTMSYDAIVAFEQTAVRNGRMLVDLANKVDVTGMPVVERWIRAGRRAVEGDPDVSAFNAQMQVYRTEAARILTNPNLTGQLTDSARHEVESFLSTNDSAEQITRVVNLLERDFENRKGTMVQQMDAIRDRMTKGYGAGGAANTAPSAAPAAGPQPGQRSKSRSGRDIIFNNGVWEYVQ